jgi:hypothetical protein
MAGNYNSTAGTVPSLTAVLNEISRPGVIDAQIRKTLVANNAFYALIAGKAVPNVTGKPSVKPALIEQSASNNGYFENFVLLKENSNITWRSGTEGLTNTTIDLGDRPQIPVRNIVGTIPLYMIDTDLNSGAENKIVSLVKTATEQAIQTAENLMGAGAFALGSEFTSKTLWGLRYWCPDTVDSGTVAGIDTSAETNYRTASTNATGISFATNAENYISALQLSCTFGANRTPDLLIMDNTSYSRFKAIFRARNFMLQKSERMTALGFEAISFDGMDVMADANCPAGSIFAITTDLNKLVTVKGCNFAIGDFVEPVDAQYRSAKMKFRGNMVMLDRKPNGKIYNFTTA